MLLANVTSSPSRFLQHSFSTHVGDWSVSWTVDRTLDSVRFQVSGGWHAEQPRWFGLGFNEQSRMAGLDSVVGWIKSNGSVVVTDRYSSMHQKYPLLDRDLGCRSDVKNVSGEVGTVVAFRLLVYAREVPLSSKMVDSPFCLNQKNRFMSIVPSRMQLEPDGNGHACCAQEMRSVTMISPTAA
jgi:hypothetical protein